MFIILSGLGSESSFSESNKLFEIRPLGEWRLHVSACQRALWRALGWVGIGMGCCLVGLEGRADVPGGVNLDSEARASADFISPNTDGLRINGLWPQNVGDSDGVFADRASLLTAGSFVDNVGTFRSVGQDILRDGQFITVENNDEDGPAGVLTGIELWLKADSGTSTSISGEALSVWNDQSGNGNHAIAGLKAPTFLHDVTGNINFNPTIRFDEAEDQLNLNVPGVVGSNEFSFYFVGII